MSEEYQREQAAFNAALPDPNTANSTADILLDKLAPRLPTSGTISVVTAADIAALPTDADVNAQADQALTDYDPPTKAEMDTGHALLAPLTGIQEYTTGSGNWTCPADVHFIDLLIVSGGAGGGGCLQSGHGGGGGGGAVGIYKTIPVKPGQTYPYVVAAVAAGGAAGDNDGVDGNLSSFAGIILLGGLKGRKGSVKTGGNGAACETLTAGAGGATGVAGGDGTMSTLFVTSTSGAGGGGGHGATPGIGGKTKYAAGGTATRYGGGGGASLGPGGNGSGITGNGTAGAVNTGAGGGGAGNDDAGGRAGGDGGSGYIKIVYRK